MVGRILMFIWSFGALLKAVREIDSKFLYYIAKTERYFLQGLQERLRWRMARDQFVLTTIVKQATRLRTAKRGWTTKLDA